MARKIITGATLPFGKRITILGQTVDVDEMSLKCGVKAIEGFSLLRLADCHSAVAMKLPKWGAHSFASRSHQVTLKYLKAGGLSCATCTSPKTGKRCGTDSRPFCLRPLPSRPHTAS